MDWLKVVLCLAGDTVGLRLVLVLQLLLRFLSSLNLEQGSAEGKAAGLLLQSQQILGAVDLQARGGDGQGRAGAGGRRCYRPQMERGFAKGTSGGGA